MIRSAFVSGGSIVSMLCMYCVCIVKLLLQVERTYLRTCKLCGHYLNVSHILFNCTNLENIYNSRWKNIYAPTNLMNSLECMNENERTLFILNAFNITYLHEWKFVYNSIACYVYKVVQTYDKRVKDLIVDRPNV